MIRSWLLVAALLLVGCGPEKDPVTRFRLVETVAGRALIETAAGIANALLGPSRVMEVVGSWKPRDPSSTRRWITVYLLAPDQLADRQFMLVPDACDCIFVQPQALTDWIAAHSTAKEAMMAVEPQDVIAYMLLHEVGHIVHGHPGQFEAGTTPDAVLNVDTTAHKAHEEEADRFAAESVAAAARSTAGSDGWFRALNVRMALSNLSWNLAALRLLDCFGCTTLSSPRAFADRTYTHPNIEMRVLTVNFLMNQDPTSKNLLDDFLEQRRRATRAP